MAKKKKWRWGCQSFCWASCPPVGPAVFTCQGCGKRFTIFEEGCGCPDAPFKGGQIERRKGKNWDRDVKRNEDWKQGNRPENCWKEPFEVWDASSLKWVSPKKG